MCESIVVYSERDGVYRECLESAASVWQLAETVTDSYNSGSPVVKCSDLVFLCCTGCLYVLVCLHYYCVCVYPLP